MVGEHMKNILSYYYGLHPEEIMHIKDSYYFDYNSSRYVFETFKRPLNDINCLYKINKQMINRNLLVHEIILNNDNNVITYVNNVPYVLMEISVNPNVRINLLDICHINNSSIDMECDSVLERNDWIALWEAKNDYIEAQINEVGKKHPELCNYANYYIGLAENAIYYVREALKLKEPSKKGVCHKRISYEDNLFDLYHPFNYVYDYRVRDVCEYVKSAFFKDEDAYNIVEQYFNNNYITYKEALLFYGRLLYPSYFFDMYDDIINNVLEDNNINNIINKVNDYEAFLLNVYIFLTHNYDRYVPGVDWIIKRSLI